MDGRAAGGGMVPLTAAEIATQKAAHDERVRLYNECLDVENALRNQLLEAIDDDYLATFRDTLTGAIMTDIPTIMNELISMYGNITAMELMNRENNVLEFAYDPTTPIDGVFNRVQDFQDLCELVRKAKTDVKEKLIELA